VPFVYADSVNPRITRINIISNAGTDNTYVPGDKISFAVTFSEEIRNERDFHYGSNRPGSLTNRNAPKFYFQLGDVDKQASYSQEDTDTYKQENNISVNTVFVFNYEVQKGDDAPNGVAYGMNPFHQYFFPFTATSSRPVVVHNRITDTSGNVCSCLTQALRPHPQHKVDTSEPELVSLKIDSLPAHYSGGDSKDTYYRGEYIFFKAIFNENVKAIGQPALKFMIGDTEKQALYESEFNTAGSSQTLIFAYKVSADDRDTDGIQRLESPLIFPTPLPPNQQNTEGYDHITNDSGLALNPDSLTEDSLSADPNTFAALENQAEHKVDGSRIAISPDTVFINTININSPHPLDSLEAGQQVFVHFTFSEPITVNQTSGTPYINIHVGNNEREAYYSNLIGGNTLVFAYTIKSTDSGTDDITLSGETIKTNGGSIGTSSSSKELDLRFSDYDSEGGIKVIDTTVHPVSGGYNQGDTFDVHLTFNECLSVDGRHSLNIKLGNVERQARYLGNNPLACNNENTVIPFSYTISTLDTDWNPIYVIPGTVNLDGSSFMSDGNFPMDINLQYQKAHMVTVDSVEVTTTGPYATGEKILVDLTFSEAVEVTPLAGTSPSINIQVKGQTRTATYEDADHTDNVMTFAYEVNTSTEIEDSNIVIPERGRINLKGGQIQSSSHKQIHLQYNFSESVQTPSPITIRSINVTSIGPYIPNNNDKILIDATFNAPVVVTSGIPSLLIQVGGRNRLAHYSPHEDISNVDAILTFVYQVTGEDSNTGNIVIPANRINTNGSEIRDRSQLRTVNTLYSGHNNTGDDETCPPGSRVGCSPEDDDDEDDDEDDETEPNPPGTPIIPPTGPITVDLVRVRNNDGLEVVIDVLFNANVELTGTNNPSIDVQVGANTRRATYSSFHDTRDADNILTFSYQFSKHDADTDNIRVPSGTINLRGNTLSAVSGGSRKIVLDHPTTTNTGTVDCDPSTLDTTAFQLENPAGNSIKSGIHVISGWACSANTVEAFFNDGQSTFQMLYGASREDTKCVCGDADNGFIALFNYNLLDDGQHTISLHIDGEEKTKRNFSVMTLGEEFIREESASGSITLSNQKRAFIKWEQGKQGFDIVGFDSKREKLPPLSATPSDDGYLGIPKDGSIKSGVHIISGWVCEGRNLTVKFTNSETSEDVGSLKILHGSERADTQSICGDKNNRFSTVFNYNTLEEGTYIADLYVDGYWQDSAEFQVVRMGAGPSYEFVTGLQGEGTVTMDVSGQQVTLRWEQATQGFEIIDVQEVP